ncbi:MAG: phosphoenolpyruvate synthase [Bacteroidia bacterium]
MNIIEFSNITLKDLPEVGGKNSSSGEMFNKLRGAGVRVPDGFVVTASAYRQFLKHNQLESKLKNLLDQVNINNLTTLAEIGSRCRQLVLQGEIPELLTKEILTHFKTLKSKYGEKISVAVRSSGTAEDLPNASFAGQHNSFLNVNEDDLLNKCKACFASLFNDRAIKYRVQMGFDHMKIGLSVGIQKMIRSDLASSGVAFTIEPETGFSDFIYITGVWGLGENIVQGTVTPDEFYLFKPSLKKGANPIIAKKCGEKSQTMVFGENELHIVNVDTPAEKRETLVLNTEELVQLGKWCLEIEKHYQSPMDIEWAKDGTDGKLYIVQARPETIHHGKERNTIKSYRLKSKANAIVTGRAVGNKIVSGIARIINDPKEGNKLAEGEILVTDNTSPDWNTVLKKASVIVTNKGGRTSHASIVARELGLSAVVGTGNATALIKDGDEITVSCAEGETGKIYRGKLDWSESEIKLQNIRMPKTSPMLILADPSRALEASFYPNAGVGLLRMEFIINNSVQVHPMALVNFNSLKDADAKNKIALLTKGYAEKPEYFTDKLSQGIGMIAAAFFPKDVIVRMSDFKTNEYSDLLGGKEFEPVEENPMLGFRGASRYYNERYKEGFRLECEAIKIVREEMGLTNVKLMIPFCRTIEEGKKVIAAMEESGLKRGENGLEIYVMAEIPSNVVQAEEFAEIFDGFSIGSNDLTQLTLGIDRDSEIISNLFSEKNPSAMWMISTMIKKAKHSGSKIGLCGQAPSDYPEFAAFLVEQGIDSISFNPDALLNGIENINRAETSLKQKNISVRSS